MDHKEPKHMSVPIGFQRKYKEYSSEDSVAIQSSKAAAFELCIATESSLEYFDRIYNTMNLLSLWHSSLFDRLLQYCERISNTISTIYSCKSATIDIERVKLSCIDSVRSKLTCRRYFIGGSTQVVQCCH
jgi:hypothetical protein